MPASANLLLSYERGKTNKSNCLRPTWSLRCMGMQWSRYSSRRRAMVASAWSAARRLVAIRCNRCGRAAAACCLRGCIESN
jgi:hypothetical protein